MTASVSFEKLFTVNLGLFCSSTALHSQSGTVYLQRHGLLPHPLSEDSGPLLSHLPQPCRLQYVHVTRSHVFATLHWGRSETFLIPSLSARLSALASGSVIEVASGEYGDLNPVLFEAVQGGMCALEEKKNQCDSNGSSVCATRCPTVRSRTCAAVLQSGLNYQLGPRTLGGLLLNFEALCVGVKRTHCGFMGVC